MAHIILFNPASHLMKDLLFPLYRKGSKLREIKLLKVLQLVNGKADVPD